jgi:para-nitrobenzyl esterase
LTLIKKFNRFWNKTNLDLENTMSSYWVNFAKTGNPNGKDLPLWEAYNKELGIILELGDKVILQKALFKKELDFLEKASKR